jgi:hypothetical protein
MSKLKIKPEHYELLKKVFEAGKALVPSKEAYREAGMSDKRWRWDAMWAGKKVAGELPWGELYKYLNDDHIDSALRQIAEV